MFPYLLLLLLRQLIMKKAKSSRSVIPLHRLEERTGIGIELYHQSHIEAANSQHVAEVHRDDYYIFGLQQSGFCNLMVDFEEMKLKCCAAFYLLPGQVHHYISSSKLTGWFMAIDASLISEELRGFFNEYLMVQKPLPLNKASAAKLDDCARLLYDQLQQEHSSFRLSIINQLAGAFIAMIADYYQQNQPTAKVLSRSVLIARQFKAMLPAHAKIGKSPAAYSAAMNYSLAHLNESVKTVTGFPVSYWIHHHVVTEAKRLLYYSPLSVKEIAAELGYEDSAYFSRLFSKMTGMAPGSFRAKFRE